LVKLSDYYPSQTLSVNGKQFLDNFLGAVFDQRKDVSRFTTAVKTEYSSGDRSIVLKSVPSDLKVGDVITVTNDIGDNIVIPYVVYDNGQYRNIRIRDIAAGNYEVRRVKSVTGTTVELDYPLNSGYAIESSVIIMVNGQNTHKILFEDIADVTESALKLSSISDENILNTYRVYTDPTNGDVYDIPLDNKNLFAQYPDVNSIEVSYVEPSTLNRVYLRKGVDYFVDATEYTINGYTLTQNVNKTIRLAIKRDSTVAKPVNVSGFPVYRVLQIDYQPQIPSGITVSDSTIQLNYQHGKYLRDSTIVFDTAGDFYSGLPEQSTNLMTVGDEIIDWVKLKTQYAVDAYRYLTAMDSSYDILPLSEEELIKESKNIHSIKGTRDSITSLISTLGISVSTIEEEYGLELLDGLKRYEVFSINQLQIPSFEFIKALHQFRDNSSYLTKNTTIGYGNSGAYSYTKYYGDFSVSYTVGVLCDCYLGLTTDFIDYTTTNIDCAVELTSAGNINLNVNGVVQSASVGTYTSGDIITITNTSNVYSAYLNGVLLGTFTLTTEPRLPIVSFSSTNSFITYGSVDNGGNVEELFWYTETGADRGFSILQRYLQSLIPSSIYSSSSPNMITVKNAAGVGYTVPQLVLNSAGASVPIERFVLNAAGAAFDVVDGLISIWSDYELRLVYAYMFTRTSTFQPVFYNTITDALRTMALQETQYYSEILPMSLFSLTVDRSANAIYSGYGLDIRSKVGNVVDLTRPFTRYMSDDDFLERVNLLNVDTGYVDSGESLYANEIYIPVKNSSGTIFNASPVVLNSSGTPIYISVDILNAAGTSFDVSEFTTVKL